MDLKRRTFFKTMLLGAAALATPTLTKLEAKEAAKIPAPRPLFGSQAYVTTVKGPIATVKHGLNRPHVFVRAVNFDGKERVPRVEPIDAVTLKLTFEEPWSVTGRRKIYKVVVFC